MKWFNQTKNGYFVHSHICSLTCFLFYIKCILGIQKNLGNHISSTSMRLIFQMWVRFIVLSYPEARFLLAAYSGLHSSFHRDLEKMGSFRLPPFRREVQKGIRVNCLPPGSLYRSRQFPNNFREKNLCILKYTFSKMFGLEYRIIYLLSDLVTKGDLNEALFKRKGNLWCFFFLLCLEQW